MSGKHKEIEVGGFGRGRLLFVGAIGLLLLLRAVGLIRALFGVDLAILLTFLGGYRLFYEAFLSLLRKEISADLAFCVAAVAAIISGQPLAAAEVIFIRLIGEALEGFAVSRTRKAVREIASLVPQKARVRREGEEVEIPVEHVVPGDVVVVRPGEQIPVDGEVIAGRSAVDQSAVTGEPLPVEKGPGEEVYAGSINTSGALEVRVTKPHHETIIAKVLRMVEEAEGRKGRAQRLADRYARWFVPMVFGAALLTWLVTREPIRAVSVLIVACPCAMVLATPTAVVTAIGRLVREGVLVKGGAELERLGEVDCVAFDKTGTLTTGRPEVVGVVAFEGLKEAEVVALAASAELLSEHPIGEAIVSFARSRLGKVREPEEFKALPGLGVEAVVGGRRVLVGSAGLLKQMGLKAPSESHPLLSPHVLKGRTVVFVAVEGRVVGALLLSDRPREGAKEAVRRLRGLGVERLVMLTGDNERAARAVAAEVGLYEVRAGLLPEDKVAEVEALRRQGHRVAMVGDGINDAPALAASDCGVAMGGIGADLAIEAASAIVLGDDPRKVAEAVEVSRRAVRKIHVNIAVFALLFNGVAVGLAAYGLIKPVVAALVHQASSLSVVLNSLALFWAGRFFETPVGRALLGLGRAGRVALGCFGSLAEAALDYGRRRPKKGCPP